MRDDEDTHLTRAEAKAIAEEAAKSAVEAVLSRLGIDPDPRNTREMQADMIFLRDWRTSAGAVKRQGTLALVTLVVAGIAGLIWAVVRNP